MGARESTYIYDALPEPVVELRGSEAVYMNAAAQNLFGESVTGDVFGAELAESGSDVTGTFTYMGETYTALASGDGGRRLILIQPNSRGGDIGKLSAAMAHMNSLVTMSKLLTDQIIRETDIEGNDAAKDTLGRLLHTYFSMSRISRNLETLCDECGFDNPHNINMTVFDVAEMCAHVIDMVCEIMDLDEQRLNFSSAPDSIRFYGDKAEIERVFLNLLVNALDNSPRDSEITVTVAIRFYGVSIYVHNFGREIPPRRQRTLFQSLSANENDMSDNSPGLGLAVVQHIVSSYGGRVSLSSSEENGTGVDVFLPFKKPQKLSLRQNRASYGDDDDVITYMRDMSGILDSKVYLTYFLDS